MKSPEFVYCARLKGGVADHFRHAGAHLRYRCLKVRKLAVSFAQVKDLPRCAATCLQNHRNIGGGGGGGVRAVPVGVSEISDQQTRFVPIDDRKKLTGAVLMGAGFGMWLGWRRRR
jgi:hypothetical protein